MSKIAKLWLVVAILVFAAGVAFWLFNSGPSGQDTTNSTESAEHDEVQADIVNSDQAADLTIIYGENGFDRTEYSVKAGGIVAIKNESSRLLDFGSDPHPTHTDQPQLNVTDVTAGSTVKFKITAIGRWGFHNHLNPAEHSFIKVE